MLVKDLMTSKVITVSPDTKVGDVAQLIHEHHFTGVPVVNKEGRVVGTISERDFITANSGLYLPTYIKMLSSIDFVQGAHKSLPDSVNKVVNATAKDIMNQSVPFVRPDTTMEELASVFAVKRVNPIPVTDADNRLLGIISRSDLIKFFSPKEMLSANMANFAEGNAPRDIDTQAEYTVGQFTSKFAYVAKARANIWLTAAIVLFIIGFVGGIIYVADPNIFSDQKAAQTDKFYKVP
ncbi:MAG TPA: CBS domain-containing protein [Patescibacteria group bacterium]|jgi:CBS domain-containing protein|nr:CBS domain-containing protein [Patescibacteria group bacterium]